MTLATHTGSLQYEMGLWNGLFKVRLSVFWNGSVGRTVASVFQNVVIVQFQLDESPLNAAAKMNSTKAIALLIDKGADVLSRNRVSCVIQ